MINLREAAQVHARHTRVVPVMYAGILLVGLFKRPRNKPSTTARKQLSLFLGTIAKQGELYTSFSILSEPPSIDRK